MAETQPAFLAAVDAAVADPEAGRERRLAAAVANSWSVRVADLKLRLEGSACHCPGAVPGRLQPSEPHAADRRVTSVRSPGAASAAAWWQR